MSYASIEDLRSQLGRPEAKSDVPRALNGHTPEYAAKMLHPLPNLNVLDRSAFILEAVKGKRVLEFGATGPMHDAVVKAAASVFGVDREDGDGVVGFDLDDVAMSWLPGGGNDATWVELDSVVREPTGWAAGDKYDVVLCGEVIEHLSNPGHFLARLRRQYPGVPVLITVPNAFTSRGRGHLDAGLENVNIDHVAWYSPRTLRTLLERAGYGITNFAWYGGKPPHSEGLIVIAESMPMEG